MGDFLLELFYVLVGCLMYLVAFNIFKDTTHKTRIGTMTFWVILGSIFIFGSYLPGTVVGALLVIIGVLTATKQVNMGKVNMPEQGFTIEQAKRLGNKIFLPSLAIVIIVVCVAKFTSLSGTVAIGIAACITLVFTLLLTKAPIKKVGQDGNRMLQAIGAMCILPQLLASLGTLFTEAGVGDVISRGIAVVIPEGNILLGVIAYCVGMALFTMIMGNAFAAFSVITVGIGVPFVFAQGGNVIIASTLALTAGYCGTLLTPMAANFNVLPAVLLQTKDKNAVIKHQVMLAIPLLIIHIALMYFWAF
ncbi:DUF979 domain-containing protein [Niameybacter massiliensis]|uniref:DUF979 domain-containing protein n=1 Tax=Holtiella tumoricola TaxID=3018743 RepID=A0AA42DRI3_9FIRM|nr:DUF979 domain-containing protein [Holtiella tumoricola]MDA3733980.1 DUF979 domain-containing protein [Holtiella tumoricola]